MEPLLISFRRDNPSLLSLTEDETTRLKYLAQKMTDTLGFLLEVSIGSTNKATTVGTVHNGASLIESYAKEIGEVLKYEGTLAKEFEERYGDLRRANQQIRELEKRMGEMQPLDALNGMIDRAQKIVQDWWKSQGFGCIFKWTMTAHGIMTCELHPDFHSIGFYDSDQPVTKKRTLLEVIQQHELAGLTVLPGTNPSHPETDRSLQDTESNRGYLLNLLNSRFPKARITKWESFAVDHRSPLNLYQIRSCEVIIPYDDLLRDAPAEKNDE